MVITGASGFTGRHACGHFLSLGLEVTAWVRSAEAAQELGRLFPRIRIFRVDMTDAAGVSEALAAAKPDYALHLAGLNDVRGSWLDPARFMAANVMSTVHLIDGARREAPDCRILAVGSALVPPLDDGGFRPPHPYSLSKGLQALCAVHLGRLYGLWTSVAQPSNLIGPGFSGGLCGLLAQHIVRMETLGGRKPFRLSSLHETRDFLDVRDAVRAYGSILLRGESGRTYFVGTGRERTLGEIIRLFEEELGRSIPLEVEDRPAPPAPKGPDISPLLRLGWSPAVGIEMSIRDILAFYRAHDRAAQSGKVEETCQHPTGKTSPAASD